MQTHQPQIIEDPALRPPGYDPEAGKDRTDEAHNGSDDGPGSTPRLRSKPLHYRTPSGWKKTSGRYTEDGVFWAYPKNSLRPSPLEEEEEVMEVISQEAYYQDRITTDVATGEAVTRYVVPTRFSPTVTASKEKAEQAADSAGVERSKIRSTEGVRALHGTHGSTGWTYWSDNMMSPAVDREEIGDLSATGNGQFSEDAEELLTSVWIGGASALEHMTSAKRRLRRVAETVTSETLLSLRERYGMMAGTSHHQSLKHIWTVREVDSGRGWETDDFFLLETVYVSRYPDGDVDRQAQFFDSEMQAREAFHSTYAGRRALQVAYTEGRRRFKDRYPKIVVMTDEEGQIQRSGRKEDVLRYSFGLGNEQDPIRVDEGRIQLPDIKNRNVLLFGINHYMVTGERFGEGVTYRIGDHLFVVLGHRKREKKQAVAPGTTERNFQRLRARLEEIGDEEVEIIDDGTAHEMKWYRLRVPRRNAARIGQALAEKEGPEGWGTPKAEYIDRYESPDLSAF